MFQKRQVCEYWSFGAFPIILEGVQWQTSQADYNGPKKQCDWYDSDVDATLLMLKSGKNHVLIFFYNPFLHFLHFFISGWVIVMSCWST